MQLTAITFQASSGMGPVPGARLFTYAAGTLTPQATYTRADLAEPNTNPVVCDAAGQAAVWLDPTLAYRLRLETPYGGLIADRDSVDGGNSLGVLTALANASDPTKGAALIGYSGAPGPVGTVADKLGLWASVRDTRYGAVGDGSTDDTGAIASALAAGGNVVIPAGFNFKITGYIPIPSNTTLLIFGTVQLTNRNAGFYTNGASNVGIYGNKIGSFIDPSVASGYVWNTVTTTTAPAIHIRSGNNVIIDGLNFNYVRVGVLVSNATTNTAPGASFALTQPSPSNITVSNCTAVNIEGAGICCYSGQYVTYSNNYIGRCGDGGLWMMGCIKCRIINNHRISPQTNAADAAIYGTNVLSRPSTWNDVQGIELENCHSVLVQGNVVENFCQLSIDIKNSCAEIDVVDNLIYAAEASAICVRPGDAVQNAVHRVSIRGNQIFNLGTPQLGLSGVIYQGGILINSCYLANVSDNVFHGWQSVSPIVCQGPGSYLMSQYGANAVQAAITVQNNKLWFKNSFQETVPAFGASATTPSAIVVTGFHDSVTITGNLIKADRFLSADSRTSAIPAISLTSALANSIYYPASSNVSSNTISNWMGRGIDIVGVNGQSNCGCVVNGNNISGVGERGIHGFSSNGIIVSNNNISNVGSGAGAQAIHIEGPGGGNPLYNAVVNGNNIYGRQDGGTNTMTFGIQLDTATDCTVIGNSIRAAATATVSFPNQAGEIKVFLTDGFPRQQSGTPVGVTFPLFIGEQIFATTAGKWWQSHAVGSVAAWTQLSN